MVYENIDRFMAHFVAGSGLLCAGGLNLIGAKFAHAARIGATAVVAGGIVGLAVALFDTTRFVPTALAILLPSLLLLHLLGSNAVLRTLAGFCRFSVRPLVRAAVVLVAGLGLIFSSAIVFDRRDAALIDAGMTEFAFATSIPSLEPHTALQARTDRGEPVTLLKPSDPRDEATIDRSEREFLDQTKLRGQYVHTSPADDASNCHGWIFAGGRAWVTGSQMQAILNQNGYAAVADPQPGDIVVYKQNGLLCHSALVRVAYPGEPTIVEGKWGWMGIYLHPVDQSLYGPDYVYYRSSRPGHILDGLDSRSPASRRRVR